MAWTDLTFTYGQILTSAQMTALDNNFEAVTGADSGAPRVSGKALGTYPMPTGVGSLGSVTITADTAFNRGSYEFDNLTVNSAATITCADSSNAAVILMVRGTATINGNINLTGQGARGGGRSNLKWDGFRGEDGTCAAGGSAGISTANSGNRGGGNGFWGIIGGNSQSDSGTSVPAEMKAMMARRLAFDPLLPKPISTVDSDYVEFDYGWSCGGGGGGAGSGNGGCGGGVIVLICDTLVFGGSMIADGLDGSSGAPNGAGGGGGGAVIVFTRTITSNTGSMSAVGGAGVNTTTDGGDGGDGLTVILQQ